MTYKDFELSELIENFALHERYDKLFLHPVMLEPTRFLLDYLAETEGLALRSEKARSEMLVLPILLELRRHNRHLFNIYSGERLNVDKKRGLTGECDFILAHNRQTFTLHAPILCLVEAKKNDLELGLPQCVAQMIAAHEYNVRLHEPLYRVYGCVTTGTEWQFLALDRAADSYRLLIDTDLYTAQNLARLLGVLQTIIDEYRDILSPKSL